jgi:hypothetical protein
VVFQSDLFD